MRKILIRSIILVLITVLSLGLSTTQPSLAENEVQRFSDVPQGHWADTVVHDLRRLNITDGIGNNNFGIGVIITRGEFIAYLVRLMQWELVTPEQGSFTDNMDSTKWYYSYVETALKNGVIKEAGGHFRPSDPITREEQAIMIVNTLGYDKLAMQLASIGSSFDDVTANTGYITIAEDFGIITGVGGNKFKPTDPATRDQAAAMMMRMYNRLNQPLEELHAFYAISSYNQYEMINNLNSVGFGWSRLAYDANKHQVYLNTTRDSVNEYGIPSGFHEPLDTADKIMASTQLMVFADNNLKITTQDGQSVAFLEYVLNHAEVRKQVISSITEHINATEKDGSTLSFDGVVIDFESLKGDAAKQALNVFLEELKTELMKTDKKLYVAVHPQRRAGQAYFDGYDYKRIGELADKVILMAHDYYAKTLTDADMNSGYTLTPLTPIDEVYYALMAITEKNTGVEDLSKIWLQMSFDAVQWKLKDGVIINRTPYSPSYSSIRQRILEGAEMTYSVLNQNPYITFTNSQDGTYNVVWYEDSRSIQAKLKLARMFGINGISLWRLGNVPDFEEAAEKQIYLDIWQQIQNNKKQ